MKNIVYVRIDGIIAEVEQKMMSEVYECLQIESTKIDISVYDKVPSVSGGLEAVNTLLKMPQFEVYFISTPYGPDDIAWADRKFWAERLFNKKGIEKRLILCHDKQLLVGDYLVDDSWINGSLKFMGQWIAIGLAPKFPGWEEVLLHLIEDQL
jgi:5'(3')-deoxyribonucleotidase